MLYLSLSVALLDRSHECFLCGTWRTQCQDATTLTPLRRIRYSLYCGLQRLIL
jgi:hypothetical protein